MCVLEYENRLSRISHEEFILAVKTTRNRIKINRLYKMTTNLTAKTVQGIGWAGVSQAIRLILHLGIIAVIARLLTPKDFGLVAMVVVFTNFIMIFRNFGLSAALIQRRELNEEHLSSCFWMNIFVGLFLSLLIAASCR